MAPSQHPGFWGTPTATIDWCERNYEFSHYVAEMTNTLSNLVMIITPLWGMCEVLKQGFDKKFIFCYCLLLLVGVGSWAFHMTLLYEMQLFDELPMVWGTCVLVYCLSEVRRPKDNGQVLKNLKLFIFLVSYAILFTVLYLYWPQPFFQHGTYGLLVLTSYVLEVKLLKLKNCKVCKSLFVVSTAIYLLGFFLWNVDKVFCNELDMLRSKSHPALNPITQLHGWWHCMAGYGTYLQILLTIHSTYDFRGKKNGSLALNPLFFGLSWSKRVRE